VKKYFISKVPRGVCMYLLAMARLTVVSWMPTTVGHLGHGQRPQVR
jgi:hypothetical protein